MPRLILICLLSLACFGIGGPDDADLLAAPDTTTVDGHRLELHAGVTSYYGYWAPPPGIRVSVNVRNADGASLQHLAPRITDIWVLGRGRRWQTSSLRDPVCVSLRLNDPPCPDPAEVRRSAEGSPTFWIAGDTLRVAVRFVSKSGSRYLSRRVILPCTPAIRCRGE